MVGHHFSIASMFSKCCAYVFNSILLARERVCHTCILHFSAMFFGKEISSFKQHIKHNKLSAGKKTAIISSIYLAGKNSAYFVFKDEFLSIFHCINSPTKFVYSLTNFHCKIPNCSSGVNYARNGKNLEQRRWIIIFFAHHLNTLHILEVPVLFK